MDITEITETDPKKIFVAIDKSIRPEMKVFHGSTPEATLKAYFEKMRHAAKSLEIDLSIQWPDNVTTTNLEEFYQLMTAEVDKVKIDIILKTSSHAAGVALDNTWRDKIHTYVAHIRQIVNQADGLPVQIKEAILEKLHAFDAEVDRARTRIAVFSDAFVRICEGFSAGTKALGPAVKLGERILGSLARLSGAPTVLALPSPEQLDLPAPETVEQQPDC